MDTLYNAILSLLNSLLPISYTGSLLDFNEVLAYFIVIVLLWKIFVKPLLSLIERKK
jgi:hypothetical protein